MFKYFFISFSNIYLPQSFSKVMLNEFIIVFIGGLLIVLLARLVIKRSIDLAEHWGLSETFVGMTILSIGTSLPEILTHVMGSIQIIQNKSLMDTVSALVIGTNIGSDIFQQNFILGIVAIIGTLVVLRKEIKPIIGGLIGGALILLIVSFGGFISKIEGAILFFGYFIYLIYLSRKGLNDKVKAKNHLDRRDLIFTIVLLLTSFGIMAFLANVVLESSQTLVKNLPISASFFGIVILGVVAALPELTTALIAIKEQRKGMSIGVLIGSNITNPTFAVGLGAMISSYTVPNVVVYYDLPVKILGALVILWFLWKYEKIGKKEAIVLIGMFVIYLIIRNMFFPIDLIG